MMPCTFTYIRQSVDSIDKLTVNTEQIVGNSLKDLEYAGTMARLSHPFNHIQEQRICYVEALALATICQIHIE